MLFSTYQCHLFVIQNWTGQYCGCLHTTIDFSDFVKFFLLDIITLLGPTLPLMGPNFSLPLVIICQASFSDINIWNKYITIRRYGDMPCWRLLTPLELFFRHWIFAGKIFYPFRARSILAKQTVFFVLTSYQKNVVLLSLKEVCSLLKFLPFLCWWEPTARNRH